MMANLKAKIGMNYKKFFQVSYMIVDDMHHNHPELMKDVYWNQTVPSALPYTVETGKMHAIKNVLIGTFQY